MAIVRRLGREYRDHHPYPENVLWLVEYSNTSLSKDLDAKQRLYIRPGPSSLSNLGCGFTDNLNILDERENQLAARSPDHRAFVRAQRTPPPAPHQACAASEFRHP